MNKFWTDILIFGYSMHSKSNRNRMLCVKNPKDWIKASCCARGSTKNSKFSHLCVLSSSVDKSLLKVSNVI